VTTLPRSDEVTQRGPAQTDDVTRDLAAAVHVDEDFADEVALTSG
jgi:hypothetical protein